MDRVEKFFVRRERDPGRVRRLRGECGCGQRTGGTVKPDGIDAMAAIARVSAEENQMRAHGRGGETGSECDKKERGAKRGTVQCWEHEMRKRNRSGGVSSQRATQVGNGAGDPAVMW